MNEERVSKEIDEMISSYISRRNRKNGSTSLSRSSFSSKTKRFHKIGSPSGSGFVYQKTYTTFRPNSNKKFIPKSLYDKVRDMPHQKLTSLGQNSPGAARYFKKNLPSSFNGNSNIVLTFRNRGDRFEKERRHTTSCAVGPGSYGKDITPKKGEKIQREMECNTFVFKSKLDRIPEMRVTTPPSTKYKKTYTSDFEIERRKNDGYMFRSKTPRIRRVYKTPSKIRRRRRKASSTVVKRKKKKNIKKQKVVRKLKNGKRIYYVSPLKKKKPINFYERDGDLGPGEFHDYYERNSPFNVSNIRKSNSSSFKSPERKFDMRKTWFSSSYFV